jgi:hypothetical protein
MAKPPWPPLLLISKNPAHINPYGVAVDRDAR